MKNTILPLLRRRHGGFTLAEVMIAMGIVATVMVALLGMIPLGVRSVREATNLTLSGRIAQEVISNVQQSNWSDLDNSFDNKVFPFDNDGFLIRTGDDKNRVQSYEARVRLAESNTIHFGTTEYSKDTLRKIFVEVEYTPDGQKIPPKKDDPEGNRNVRKYNFYVANQNKTG